MGEGGLQSKERLQSTYSVEADSVDSVEAAVEGKDAVERKEKRRTHNQKIPGDIPG